MIDVVLSFVLIGVISLGYYRGFVWQVLRFMNVIVLLVILYLFGNQLITCILPTITPWFEATFLNSVPILVRHQVAEYIIRIIFSITFYIIIHFILRRVLSLFHGKIIKKIPIVGILNSLLGSCLAFIEYLLILLLAVALLKILGADTARYVSGHSYIIMFVQNLFPSIIKLVQVFWS